MPREVLVTLGSRTAHTLLPESYEVKKWTANNLVCQFPRKCNYRFLSPATCIVLSPESIVSFNFPIQKPFLTKSSSKSIFSTVVGSRGCQRPSVHETAEFEFVKVHILAEQSSKVQSVEEVDIVDINYHMENFQAFSWAAGIWNLEEGWIGSHALHCFYFESFNPFPFLYPTPCPRYTPVTPG